MVNLGDVFPNFDADSTAGKMKFHDFIGDSWTVLFSHPADYTPVCTTELAAVVSRLDDFKKRGVKLCALSCDSVTDHHGFAKDIMSYAGKPGEELPFPIIADEKRELAVALGMIDPDERDAKGLPLTARAVFVIGPDKTLKLSILYPATTGRNFDEILRVIDSLKLTALKRVATPANWQPGDKVMVVPTVKDNELATLFPKGVEKKEVPSGKGYLRFATL